MKTKEEKISEQNPDLIEKIESTAQVLETNAEQSVLTEEHAVNPKRQKIDKLIGHQNIKYRGIFSHRTVRIIGFLCLFCAQLVIAAHFASGITKLPNDIKTLASVLEIISLFALPLFLAANFCVIMTSQSQIKRTLIIYSIMALAIYLLIVLLYYRYISGIFVTIFKKDVETGKFLAETLTKAAFGKIINYNVFVDLSLFSLFYFFFFYTPKKIQKRSSLILFRCCSIIPILFALTATVLYGMYYEGKMNLPIAMLAILPCRSIVIYAIFFVLAILIKLRKHLFIKWGGTEEEYNTYAKSNRSSLEISVVASCVIFVLCLLDFLLVVCWPKLLLYGIGSSFYFALAIPFILLLSYTRQPKKSFWDWLIVVLFVLAVILLYCEIVLYAVQNI